MSKLLVIIPAYNEGESLEATLDEPLRVAPDVDYLVVNDGSKDATEQICRDRAYNHVTGGELWSHRWFSDRYEVCPSV